jgi:hypothetical protein
MFPHQEYSCTLSQHPHSVKARRGSATTIGAKSADSFGRSQGKTLEIYRKGSEKDRMRISRPFAKSFCLNMHLKVYKQFEVVQSEESDDSANIPIQKIAQISHRFEGT